MSDRTVPPTLYPGPRANGRPTWFARGQDIPKGWERRTIDSTAWRVETTHEPLAAQWFQVRPARLPDPPILYAFDDDEIVTLWRDMKDRPDLDQWERLSPMGAWMTFDGGRPRGWPDGLPMRVRRRNPEKEEDW